jgi:branched-chain amino acid transport system permease protein
VTARLLRVAGLGIVALAALVPFGLGPDQTHDLANLLVLVIVGVAWNLLAGYAGLISVGQQAFIGLGAYTTVWLDVHGSSPLFGVPLAALVCACAGLLVSVPIFRLRGGYFAIGTWVVAEVVLLAVKQVDSLGGGTGASLTQLSDLDPAQRQAAVYWLALAGALVVIIGAFLLLRGRQGIGLGAVRDNEEGAAAIGVDVQRSKRLVYVLAAAATGVAGALVAVNALRVQPDAVFSVDWTTTMLFIVLIGGLASLEGSILGAVVLFAAQQLFADQGSWYLIGLGAAVVLIALYLPRGGWVAITRDRISLFPLRHRAPQSPAPSAAPHEASSGVLQPRQGDAT